MNTPVVEITKTLNGFNKEAMNNFQQMATENPEGFVLGLKAKSYWEGSGGATLAKIGEWDLAGQTVSKPTRDFSLQIGAWKEVEQVIGIEGASDRLEPVEVALAALCSCINWAICINSALHDVTFEGLEITASAKLDPRILFDVLPVEASSNMYEQINLEVKVLGEASEETKAKIAEFTHRSPVRSLIAYGQNIVTNVS